MLNKYPLWKYLLIAAVLGLAFLYALPNLYPNDPAIQISTQSSARTVNEADLKRAEAALQAAGIPYKGGVLNPKNALIRLDALGDQLNAKDAVRRALGDGYVVALNLVPTTPEWLSNLGGKPLRLGLDLSGGVHFLLQVDMEKALDSRLKVYEGEMKDALRKEKLRYRSLPIKDQTIELGFNDGDAASKAEALLQKNFQQFTLTAESRGELKVLRLNLTPQEITSLRDYAVNQNLTTVRNRVNELGVAEPLVQRQGVDRIVVELPGVQDTAEAKRILGKTASLEFRFQAAPDAPAGATESFPFHPGRPPVALERSVVITGDQVTNAQSGYDENGQPEVNIKLDGVGGDMMTRATRNCVGRSLAVVFIEQRPVTRYVKQNVGGVEKEVEVQSSEEDRRVISLARVNTVLGSSFRITGLDTPAESSELALLLRAGGLAAPMYFAEERTIGPSLGEENIGKGVSAALWGMMFVSVFMIIIYRFFGILATVALGFNMVMLVALLSMLGATLTLPGIAGIVLTMGMAVDANVLIFSRIREELSHGASPQRAIHEGFDRALSAIVDANLTTLLVGMILYGMGTGPVKGFAVTLSLGIFTSVFTAIMVTRSMVNLTFGGRQVKKLWI